MEWLLSYTGSGRIRAWLELCVPGNGNHPLPTSPSPILSTAGTEHPSHCQNPDSGAAGVVSWSWTMDSFLPHLLSWTMGSFLPQLLGQLGLGL